MSQEPVSPCPPGPLAMSLTLYIRRLCTPFKPLLAYGGAKRELDPRCFDAGHSGTQPSIPSDSRVLPSIHVCVLHTHTHTHFAVYNALLCICTPMFLAQTLRKKIFCFNFLFQFLMYSYLETKPIIVFQGAVLHVDIITSFWSYIFNT